MDESVVTGWLAPHMEVDVARARVTVRRHYTDRTLIDQYIREDASRMRELERENAELREENGKLRGELRGFYRETI